MDGMEGENWEGWKEMMYGLKGRDGKFKEQKAMDEASRSLVETRIICKGVVLV